MGHIVDLAISAVLLAGLYATMAYGLGIIYGVLRIVNLNHGGMIMVGAYAGWWLHTQLGIDPYLSLIPVTGLAFLAGVVLYRVLVRRLPRGAAGGVQSLLLLFGVWLVLRNAAYLLFTGNDQTIRTEYSTRSVSALGLALSVNRVAVFGIAVLMLIALHLFLTRTFTGKAIRAVAQNADSCTLVGVDVERIYALTFAIGTALAGLAGLLGAMLFSFNPSYGSSDLLKSFVIVALAWNWMGGYLGQVSFGHSAMFGIGGFISARLLLAVHVPFWSAWIVGGVVAALYALLWGHPTLRLRGPYFSIATIGVGEATRLVMTCWEDLT